MCIVVCVYVFCMYVWVCVRLCVYIYMKVCVYVRTCVFVCTCACLYACVYICLCVSVCIYKYIHLCLCVYVFVYVCCCVFVSVCMCKHRCLLPHMYDCCQQAHRFFLSSFSFTFLIYKQNAIHSFSKHSWAFIVNAYLLHKRPRCAGMAVPGERDTRPISMNVQYINQNR